MVRSGREDRLTGRQIWEGNILVVIRAFVIREGKIRVLVVRIRMVKCVCELASVRLQRSLVR